MIEAPNKIDATKVRIESTIIQGTKILLTLSARVESLVLVLVASTTKATILEIVESFPIFSASYSI